MKAPIVRASVYAPATGRRRWLAAYTCPYGCSGHLARSSAPIPTAGLARRTGCGRRIVLVPARVYRSREAAA